MEGRIVKIRTKLEFRNLPKDYAGLCRVLLPRPIRDNVDYDEISEVADAMSLWREKFSSDQADYFEILCTLIEDYDAKHVRWPKIRGVDALKHLLNEQRLAPVDLSKILGGSRNLGGMILRGDRK